MKGMRRRVFLTMALGGIATGCSAPGYQPAGLAGGYSERKLDETIWYVRFDGNSYSLAEEISVFWLYRAAEITVRESFTHFRVLHRQAGLAGKWQPWCDGTVQLLRHAPATPTDQIYDAQLVLHNLKRSIS